MPLDLDVFASFIDYLTVLVVAYCVCTVDANAVSDTLRSSSLACSAGQSGGITVPSVPVIEQVPG